MAISRASDCRAGTVESFIVENAHSIRLRARNDNSRECPDAWRNEAIVSHNNARPASRSGISMILD